MHKEKTQVQAQISLRIQLAQPRSWEYAGLFQEYQKAPKSQLRPKSKFKMKKEN